MLRSHMAVNGPGIQTSVVCDARDHSYLREGTCLPQVIYDTYIWYILLYIR